MKKTTIRNFIFVLIAVGGMSLHALNALGADDAMPSEVQVLIGMKIPPKVKGTARASIPNFVSKGGEWGAISYEEGMVGGKWPVFIVERIDADRSLEILDVQMLPINLIDWRYVDGKFKNKSEHFKFVKNRLSLSEKCRADENDQRMIFGLIKQEIGKEACSHFSKLVQQAWMIDRQSGKITPIPTKDLQCFYLTMDDCF